MDALLTEDGPYAGGLVRGVLNWDYGDLPPEYGGLSIRENVAADANAEFNRGCNLAHFSILAQSWLGFQRGTLEWRDAMTRLGVEYAGQTSYLNGEDLRFWGLPDVTDPVAIASHAIAPIPYICLEDKTHPFDLLSVLVPEWTGPAFIANSPPPETPRLSTAEDTPPGRQRVLLETGSAGLLTVSGVGTAPVELAGALEISVTSCSEPSRCEVIVSSALLETLPFELAGYDVDHLRVTTSREETGILIGNTLILDSFSPNIEARLDDGKYDYLQVESGVLVAQWDTTSSQFVMAFAFEAEVEGTALRLNGTAFGAIDNVSPRANVALTTPHAVSNGKMLVECQGPAGTAIELHGESSFDREDGSPRLTWFSGLEAVSTDPSLTVSGLPRGSYDYDLAAYDHFGFTDSERASILVQDTLPPVIQTSDLCVWPPNHNSVEVRLGQELAATAFDQCEGTVDSTLEIVNVTSSSTSGVVDWTARGACLEASRNGNEGDRVYVVTLRATDSLGNSSYADVHVTIPHAKTIGCLTTSELSSCSVAGEPP